MRLRKQGQAQKRTWLQSCPIYLSETRLANAPAMVRKDNPFPTMSFVLLAVIGALLFAPRAIERTETTCSAVSSQVVKLMLADVTEVEMARLIGAVPGNPPEEVAREFVLTRLRHSLAEKIAPKLGLADKPWYYCSSLFWVNFVNPPSPHSS